MLTLLGVPSNINIEKMIFFKVYLSSTIVLTLFTFISAENVTKNFSRPSTQQKRHFNTVDDPYHFYGPNLLPYYKFFNPNVEYEKASLRGLLVAQNEEPQARLLRLSSFINSAIFNNRFSSEAARPFSNFINRLPVAPNPEQSSLLSSFDSCSGTNGEAGLCAPSSFCSVFGGRPSEVCTLGNVCCINTVSRCGSTITLNNTYWQSPYSSAVDSSCSVNIRLDRSLKEQKSPICQLRLDFVSFSISQPNIETVCVTDTFQVSGALNNVPLICGDNDDQHMYIHVPNSGTSPSDVQLIFKFGTGTGNVPRAWKIKIGMLPCGASYLAPTDCLQYFTETSGTVRSFNWKDISGVVRQLANQDYNVCFRTEMAFNGQKASVFCISECLTVNANVAFKLSRGRNYVLSQGNANQCNNDFIAVVGGFDPAVAAAPANNQDRFCGGALNVVNGVATASVCTTAKPFRIAYRTNGDETVIPTTDGGTTTANIANNMGFCLNFLQRNP